MRLRQASTVCRRCVSRLVRRAGAVSRLPLRTGVVSYLRRRVRFVLRECAGQGSVEYALVLFAFLGVIAGLGLLGNVLDAGVLIEHALQSASHHLSSAAPGALSDVFMY